MFGISGEHLIILLVVLLVLGPKRLPELGATMGKAIRNFKDAFNEKPAVTHAEAAKDETKPSV